MDEWAKIFPLEVSETYSGSTTFMKQLTTVAVSIILYLKAVFPDDNFTTEKFGGVNFQILKKSCPDSLAQFVSTALVKAFVAFDMKYLHILALCFYDGSYQSENLVEYHLFQYSYKGSKAGVEITSGSRRGSTEQRIYANIRQMTMKFLKDYLGTSRKRLPASVNISLRIYYNQDAPAGYQAPGYEEPIEEHITSVTLPSVLNIGRVDTGFHRLKGYSYCKDILEASYEANPSLNPPAITCHNETSPKMAQNPPYITLNDDSDFQSSSTNDANIIRCACNKNYDNLELLTCSKCKTHQHAVCYGIQSIQNVRSHVCLSCSDRDSTLTPTDTYLSELQPDNRPSMCIVRVALQWCSSNKSLSVWGLAAALQLLPLNAAKLVKLLRDNVIFRHQGVYSYDTKFTIIQKNVQIAIKKHFRTDDSDNNDIVERLIEESLSQDHDPVGDALSPEEKTDLRKNTSALKRTTSLKELREDAIRPMEKIDFRKNTLARERTISLPEPTEDAFKPMEKINLRKNTSARKRTTSSQESTGDVLSPMKEIDPKKNTSARKRTTSSKEPREHALSLKKKVDLRKNTSALKTTTLKESKEDLTLKNYKEAVLSSSQNEPEEDLPLSGNHNPISVKNIKRKPPKIDINVSEGKRFKSN